VTVFLSYAHSDLPYARRIKEALVTHDYSVWLDIEAIAGGADWRQGISTALDTAVERGFVLVLLSTSSSQFMSHEINYALSKASKTAHGANIVPIVIEDLAAVRGAMPSAVRSLLNDIQWFDFSRGDFDTNIATLISNMKTRAID
jgi:hypothetical protein